MSFSVYRAYSEIQRSVIRSQVKIPVRDELTVMRKPNLSGHALFCHPRFYFDCKIQKWPHLNGQFFQNHKWKSCINAYAVFFIAGRLLK